MSEQGGSGARSSVADVEREIRRLLRRFRRYSTELAHAVHPDLDPAVFGLLVDIADRGPARAADLVEERGVGKGVISRQVRELERLGLIERQPDPSDARARLLAVSDTGRQAVARAVQLRQENARRLTAANTADELDSIVAALARLNDLLQ